MRPLSALSPRSVQIGVFWTVSGSPISGTNSFSHFSCIGQVEMAGGVLAAPNFIRHVLDRQISLAWSPSRRLIFIFALHFSLSSDC